MRRWVRPNGDGTLTPSDYVKETNRIVAATARNHRLQGAAAGAFALAAVVMALAWWLS